MISLVGWLAGKNVAYIEQQMSAECAPGMMAFSTAMTPPTGIVPGPPPTGQASGMITPRLITGMCNSSVMLSRTLITLSASSEVSASIASARGAGS